MKAVLRWKFIARTNNLTAHLKVLE
jgi:hypothetical protein